MDELWQAARQVWTGIELEREVFVAYLADRVPPARDPHALRTTDLYLACACAQGNVRALETFERCYLGVLDQALPGITGVNAALIDDVKQQVRRKLFVAEDGPPRIREFSGLGDLRRWVRVMGVREALTITRRAHRETHDDERLEQAVLPTADPEIAYLKKRYQHELARACTTALEHMVPRDRALLRQSFVDGLTIDELGAIYRVHRATIARWLAQAQTTLTRAIHTTLLRTLQLQPAELRSILRLIRSGFQMSLRGLFDARPTLDGATGA